MKKIMSVLFALIIVITTISQTYADEGTIKPNDKIVINEFELYKSLSNKTDSELIDNGMTKQEVKELRQFNFNNVFF